MAATPESNDLREIFIGVHDSIPNTSAFDRVWRMQARALATITKAGLVSGVLDLSDALIFYGLRGVRPVLILQSIASGLLGRAAFSGGAASAVLGTLCHF